MKVLFVCLGNICRSPMAEGVLRTKAKEGSVSLEIDSCGTGDWHIGETPDERAQQCMKDLGDDISDLRARQFEKKDFDAYDRIFVMDKSNYQNVVVQASNNEQKEKVELFLNLSHPEEDREVPDPYFGGSEGFHNVYKMLDSAAKSFLKELDEQAR
jgi:protein-tyrosine phosphatase